MLKQPATRSGQASARGWISTGRQQYPTESANCQPARKLPGMTQVIALKGDPWYHWSMQDLTTWLHNMSAKPLPGGVSAAALAAAMGAALLAKTARVSLRRQDMATEDRATMQAILDLARLHQQVLLDLVEADEEAYRAVLQARVRPDAHQSRDEPWRRATRVPIRVAETCDLILRQLPGLEGLCSPVVRPDLDIARWLLEVGRRTGLLAAQDNLQAWEDDANQASLRARMAALEWNDPESNRV